MKIRLRTAALVGISALSLTLASCSDDSSAEGNSAEGTTAGSNASESNEANNGSGSQAGGVEIKAAGDYNPMERDQIQDGGELTLAITEIAEQQNVFHANMNLYTRNVWTKYNPQLSLFDGDGTWHPNPAYLTEVNDEEVDGKTQVTYTIHPDATYNDGTAIDWTAFENTWKFNNGTMEGVQVNSTDGYELIESVEKGADDKTAVVTFKQAYPWWQGLFGELVPPQIQDADTFMNAYIKQLHPEWGAGPMKVDSFDPNGGTVTFVRNEKWWGEPAKLEKITLRAMEDQASLNAFRAGEIDATGVATRDRYNTAKEMGDQVDIRAALRPSNYLLTINATAPGLEDPKVREAIMRGIDREQLAAIRFQGLDYTEELPGSFSLFQTQEGYEDNFGAVVQYDQEKSKQLLEEAGYTQGSDGIYAKDGQPLSVRYVTLGDSPMVQATTSAVQAMLKQVGVDVTIEERPSSDFSEVTANRDFDLFMMGFSSSDPFGVAYFGQIYASDSELNKSGTGSPEMDQKIEELQQISDPDEQIKRSNELEKEAFGEFGIMPYANGPDMVATKKGLANFGAMSFGVLPLENVGWAK
ncbi:ABC transporter family substrate-binding protein [Corynebacterium timonense]|uniref:Peptide/nickel transport system substrate-binding protein n=1 Tax=Corynebacterium timonense TaxID=441500 RepID=A0A1H1QHR5_9CORY|nr:ABC transporter family substrate-binding protein [Corynebacterium timonense]SDS22843.1 peptide/nickel transport system substrate-binding protein [Corynebacterium timonense]